MFAPEALPLLPSTVQGWNIPPEVATNTTHRLAVVTLKTPRGSIHTRQSVPPPRPSRPGQAATDGTQRSMTRASVSLRFLLRQLSLQVGDVPALQLRHLLGEPQLLLEDTGVPGGLLYSLQVPPCVLRQPRELRTAEAQSLQLFLSEGLIGAPEGDRLPHPDGRGGKGGVRDGVNRFYTEYLGCMS